MTLLISILYNNALNKKIFCVFAQNTKRRFTPFSRPRARETRLGTLELREKTQIVSSATLRRNGITRKVADRVAGINEPETTPELPQDKYPFGGSK